MYELTGYEDAVIPSFYPSVSRSVAAPHRGREDTAGPTPCALVCLDPGDGYHRVVLRLAETACRFLKPARYDDLLKRIADDLDLASQEWPLAKRQGIQDPRAIANELWTPGAAEAFASAPK